MKLIVMIPLVLLLTLISVGSVSADDPPNVVFTHTAFEPYTEDLWQLTNGEPKQLTEGLQAIMPDVNSVAGDIVFAVRQTKDQNIRDLWILANGTASALLLGPEDTLHPKWSPDGTRIAYSTSTGIWSWNLKESPQYVTTGTTPDWSPLGDQIVFADGSDLYLINIDGTDRTLVAQNASFPAWSPDGTNIAYTIYSRASKQWPIIVQSLDTGRRKHVALCCGHWLEWADANMIVYTKGDQLWYVDIRTYESKRMLDFSAEHNHYVGQPTISFHQ